MLAGHTFEDIPFSASGDDLSADRPLFSDKFRRKKDSRHGTHFEIKIHRRS